MIGSSPRVRGTSALRWATADALRFIPACAGNIRNLIAAPHRRAVHPRVCGEHRRQPDCLHHDAGSSPRVRGTSGRGRGMPSHERFIPACAGNIWPGLCASRLKAVHPRVCGEHISWLAMRHLYTGSSPRVRGTYSEAVVAGTMTRFIPACAGNIRNRYDAFIPTAVHPRVCGEHKRPC